MATKHRVMEEADAPGLISPWSAGPTGVFEAAGQTIIQNGSEFEGPTDKWGFFKFDGSEIDTKARTYKSRP